MKVGDLIQLNVPNVIAIVVGLSSDKDCEIMYFQNGTAWYTWISYDYAMQKRAIFEGRRLR